MSNNWSASNYRQRKASRLAARPAQWETNPETKEQFFIRPVGAISLLLSGYLSSALKEEALAGWKQHGVEPERLRSGGENGLYSDDDEVGAALDMSPQEIQRTNLNFAKTIYLSCLIPTFAATGEDVAQVKQRALANCELAFANDNEWKAASDEAKLERAADVVMDLSDLEESDAKFIFRCASRHVDNIPMKGGAVMSMADAKSLRKTPGRRARTGTRG